MRRKLQFDPEVILALEEDATPIRTVIPTYQVIQTNICALTRDLTHSCVYANALEEMRVLLTAPKMSLIGIGRQTENTTRIALEALNAIIVGKSTKFDFPAKEDFGTRMSRKDATALAAENFSKLIDGAKEAFSAIVKKIIAWLQTFWAYMTKSSGTFKDKVKEAEDLKKEVEKHENQPLLPEGLSENQKALPLRTLPPDGVKRMNSFRANRWSKVFPNPKNPLALKVKYSDEFYPAEMLKSAHKTESTYAQILKEIKAEVQLATTRLMTTQPNEDLLFEADPQERTPKLTQHFLEVLKTVDPEAKIEGDQIVFTLPCGLMQYTLTLNSSDAKCVGSTEAFRDLIEEVKEAKANGKMHRGPGANLYSAFGVYMSADMENLQEEIDRFIEALKKVASTDTSNRAKEWEYRHYVNHWLLYGNICVQLFAAIANSAIEISSGITSFWTLTLAKDGNTAQTRD